MHHNIIESFVYLYSFKYNNELDINLFFSR